MLNFMQNMQKVQGYCLSLLRDSSHPSRIDRQVMLYILTSPAVGGDGASRKHPQAVAMARISASLNAGTSSWDQQRIEGIRVHILE